MLRWKTDPSRGGGTHAAGRDGRDGPRDSADGGPWQPATTADDRQRGSAACSRHARGHTRRRWRTGGCSVGRSSGGAAGPRRRSARGELRLDSEHEPWHNGTDRLGLSELGAVTRVRWHPGPHPTSESVPTVSERPGACEHGRRGGSVRSGTGADDDPSSRRRPSHSPSRSHVQPLPLPVPRSATALRKRPRTDVRSAWSSASSESDLNRPAFKFLQEFVSADNRSTNTGNRRGSRLLDGNRISRSRPRRSRVGQNVQSHRGTTDRRSSGRRRLPQPISNRDRRGEMRRRRCRDGTQAHVQKEHCYSGNGSDSPLDGGAGRDESSSGDTDEEPGG